MNKIIFFLILVNTSLLTNAQVTIRPGVKAGLNLSNFSSEAGIFDNGNDNYRSFSPKTSYFLGGFFDLKLTKIYTLSPELLYSLQGSNYSYTGFNSTQMRTINVSYLNLNVVNKFTFSKGFYPFVGTSFDFVLDKDYSIDSEFDIAFFIGAGVTFTKNIGIDARFQKGLVPVLDYHDGNHNNIFFQLGATYTFDVKN